MMKNHLKVGLRIIARQKFISAISLLGLSLGITISMFLFLFVNHELSYDSFHQEAQNIYRINVISYNPEGNFYRNRAPAPLAKLLSETFPEVAAALTINRPRGLNFLINSDKEDFYESNVLMSDKQFFEVFSFPFIHGDSQTALSEPFQILLTEEMANKYFGKTNVIGESLTYENSIVLKITGVLKNIPSNSSLQFDFIISNQTPGILYDNWENDWGNSNANIFLRLNPDVDSRLTEAKFPALVKKYVTDLDDEERFEMTLQSLKSLHLHPHLPPEEVWAASNKKYVYFLPIVGFFILLIACFNYINLSLARATDRLKEVGIRKVMGSSRRELIQQFLIESLTLIFIATLMALVLIIVLMPAFIQLSGLSFRWYDLLHTPVLGACLSLILLITIISGIYPAGFLSGLKPIKALNQVLGSKNKHGGFARNIFLSIQFAIALILIVAAIVVHHQLNYIQQRSLGFNDEQVLYFFENDTAFWSQSASFKNELLALPNITSVAFSSGIPGQVRYSGTAEFGAGKAPLELMHIMVDYDFLSLYDFQLSEGRFFQKEIRTDETSGFLLNDAAVEAIGWDDPLERRMELWGNQGSVIGVLEDFHFESMQYAIQPLAFHFGPQIYNTVSIKLMPSELDNTIKLIENQWAARMPKRPFQYQFVEDQFASYYEAEKRFSKITDLATIIALLLAVMGLFALTTYSISRREREIGIRRILGANYAKVLSLFLKKIIALCLVALLLSIPLAYYGIELWLQSFAYRVNFSATNFFLAAGILLSIIVLTIGLQVHRLIFGNPTNALRSDG